MGNKEVEGSWGQPAQAGRKLDGGAIPAGDRLAYFGRGRIIITAGELKGARALRGDKRTRDGD